MNLKNALLANFILFAFCCSAQENFFIHQEKIRDYVEFFNWVDDEPIKNAIPNSECLDWMQKNIPLDF